MIVLRQLAGALLAVAPVAGTPPPVFIGGCQRSGTTMLLDVLRGVDGFRVYPEGDREAFGPEMRLLSHDLLRYLMFRNRGTRIVLKPLNDIQHLDALLELHPGAQAIWIYRDYRDVASSLVEKWGDAQKAHLREIASGSYSGPGSAALGEKVNEANIALVKSLGERDVTAHEAAAVVWALRNSIFFDLALDKRRNVLVVRYEDLCTEPDRFFPPLFDFLDCTHRSANWRAVHADSVSRHATPEIGEPVNQACEELLMRLDAASGSTRAASASDVGNRAFHGTAASLRKLGSSTNRYVAATCPDEKKRRVS